LELSAGVEGVIHLEVGEPDFGTPPVIIQAAKAALDSGFTRYIPNAGISSLRSAVASAVTSCGWSITPSQIAVTPGAVCALSTAVLTIVDHGDEVLIPDPGWPNYVSMVQLAGGAAVTHPLLIDDGLAPGLCRCCGTAALRTLLKLLGLKERTVTADAMHCQRETAQAVLDKQANYVLCLKANRFTMYDDAVLFIDDEPSPKTPSPKATPPRRSTPIMGASRPEAAASSTTSRGSPNATASLGLRRSRRCLRVVRRNRARFVTKRRLYALSRKMTASEALFAIRSHWHIEIKKAGWDNSFLAALMSKCDSLDEPGQRFDTG
jgi:predicted transposase YbfD/YdcC